MDHLYAYRAGIVNALRSSVQILHRFEIFRAAHIAPRPLHGIQQELAPGGNHRLDGAGQLVLAAQRRALDSFQELEDFGAEGIETAAVPVLGVVPTKGIRARTATFISTGFCDEVELGKAHCTPVAL